MIKEFLKTKAVSVEIIAKAAKVPIEEVERIKKDMEIDSNTHQ